MKPIVYEIDIETTYYPQTCPYHQKYIYVADDSRDVYALIKSKIQNNFHDSNACLSSIHKNKFTVFKAIEQEGVFEHKKCKEIKSISETMIYIEVDYLKNICLGKIIKQENTTEISSSQIDALIIYLLEALEKNE